jgi:hypothetical protein
VAAPETRGQAETQAPEDRVVLAVQALLEVLMRMPGVTLDFQAPSTPARHSKALAITDNLDRPQAVLVAPVVMGPTPAPSFGPSTPPATFLLLMAALDFEVLQAQPAGPVMRGTQVLRVIRARLDRPVTTAVEQTQAIPVTQAIQGAQARRVRRVTPERREVRAQPVQQVTQPHSWRLTLQAEPVAMPVQAEPQAMQARQVRQV